MASYLVWTPAIGHSITWGNQKKMEETELAT